MNIGTTLYSTLTAHSGLVSQVSTRIYYQRLPTNAILTKTLLFKRIANTRFNTLAGSGNLCRSYYQFDCFAYDTYSNARAIAEQLKLCLAGASFKSLLINDWDDVEPDTGCCRAVLEYAIWHNDQ